MKFALNCIAYTKINWKYIMNLDVRCKTIKLLGKKILGEKKKKKPWARQQVLGLHPKNIKGKSWYIGLHQK